MNKEKGNPPRPRGCDKAEVIAVVKTVSLRGAGTENDPCRGVIQYWDFSGKLLAENDSVKNCGSENELRLNSKV